MLTPIERPSAAQAAGLDRDGYLLLRGAAPLACREGLRQAFEAGVGPPEQWAAPRANGWRHALVDLDPVVQRVCRAPAVLAAVGHLLDEPFFFSQVEGREPLPQAGHQPLHRDGAGQRAVAALVFLDDFGPDNGATRVVPRHLDPGAPDETLAQVLSGGGGDILVFDVDVLHGATINRSGARRRTLLLSFMPERLRAEEDACRAVRNVRMDTREVFAGGALGLPAVAADDLGLAAI